MQVARDRQVEREPVLERVHGATPAIFAVSHELHGSRKAFWLDPLAGAKGAFSVGELEGEPPHSVTLFDSHRDREPRDIGAPTVTGPIDEQSAADIGSEAPRRAPEARQ